MGDTAKQLNSHDLLPASALLVSKDFIPETRTECKMSSAGQRAVVTHQLASSSWPETGDGEIAIFPATMSRKTWKSGHLADFHILMQCFPKDGVGVLVASQCLCVILQVIARFFTIFQVVHKSNTAKRHSTGWENCFHCNLLPILRVKSRKSG